MAEVKIYSTPTCPYCNIAKAWFKEKGIKFADYNVAEDHEKAHEMIKKSGQNGVPVIDVNGSILIGFGLSTKERISTILKIK